MARSTEEIFGNKSSERTVQDEPASESPATDSAESVEAQSDGETPKQEAKPAAQQDQKPEPKKAKAEEADDDEHEDSTPDDLAGLKKALAAARGDKRKARTQWRETERQLAELQGRLSVLQQQHAPQAAAAQPAQAEKDPADEFYSNPAGYVQNYVQSQVSQVRQQISRELVRTAHPDFDQVVQSFVQSINGTPLAEQLEAQLNTHPNPAQFIYDYAKTYSQVKDVGSIEDLRKKIEDEVRAKLEAEYAAKQSQQPATTQAKPIPRSLAGARGNGASVTQAWTGPRSIEEIFPSR